MTIKIEDISRKLGLSISTVSKALNGYPDVSEGTRQRVVSAALKMGYQPSASARNLRRGRTDKIGLLINHSLSYISEYLAEIIAGAALAAESNGKNIILYTETINQVDGIERICRAGEIDGALLLWANPTEQTFRLFESEKMPYVLLGRRAEYKNASFVAPDNYDGAYRLTQHLISLGHRRIGFMSRPVHGPTNDDRQAGYLQALHDAGIRPEDELIVPTLVEPDSGYKAMQKFLSLPAPPSAVFAFYDLLAVGALRALAEHNIRVPTDIAVAGFDGLHSSIITNPPITTVQQPLQQMGREAVLLLLDRIENNELPPSQVTFPVELIARQSTEG